MKDVTPRALIREAIKAAARAYCPYSRFRVGAAVRAANGTVFRGCNVENASFGLTICAERTALLSAIVAGQRHFKALAVVASGEALPYPCGACLQVLSEFCPPSLPIYLARIDRPAAVESHTLQTLLPRAFHLSANGDAQPLDPPLLARTSDG